MAVIIGRLAQAFFLLQELWLAIISYSTAQQQVSLGYICAEQ